jgi:N-acetylmuramoyl-L-alanine amidase
MVLASQLGLRCAALVKGLVAWLLVALLTSLLASGPVHARRDGQPRRQPINMVVIHSTGGPTCDAKTGRPIWVGAGTMADNIRTIEAHPTLGIHHMIDRDGRHRTSVPENQIAHHVFRFSARSIAIELINDGDGVDPFPPAQLAALVALLQGIAQRHGLAADAVVRHSDLDTSPMACDPSKRRKVDPGAAFPYQSVLERVFVGPKAAPRP